MPRLGIALALVSSAALATAAPDERRTSAATAPRTERVIEMTAKKFEFLPTRVTATEGDRITLLVRSADATHGLEIKRLRLSREIPRGGDAVMITFPAPKAGTYEIRCSEYCGRGHDRMRATLVVSPPPPGGTP